MKKILATVCIVGMALSLAACSSDGKTSNSGSSFAKGRTAGNADAVFSKSQNK